MPTYEYECKKCGISFEAFQKITDDNLENCPEEKCDGKLRRIISGGTGVIFKGPGFYCNDYPKSDVNCKNNKNKDKENDKKEGE